MQFGDGARLLLQQVLRILRKILEQLLNARHVVRRLGERTGELLDRGIAIQLERIEVAPMSALLLVPVKNLRLSFDFQAAQLLLQTCDRARQLAEVEVYRAELLLEARASDAGFAGNVEQLIEQIRVHARHFNAFRLGDRLATRRNRQGRHRDFVAVPLVQPRECNGNGSRDRSGRGGFRVHGLDRGRLGCVG